MPPEPTLREALDSLPVFPLPGVVLFPEQQLPLHIFEPRYRQMVRDALESAPYIVVAMIDGDPAREPVRLAPMATAGKIVAHQRLADGRFNIVVEGIARVSMQETASARGYRRVRCTELPEPFGEDSVVAGTEIMAMMGLVTLCTRSAAESATRNDDGVRSDLAPAQLAFRVADRLVRDAAARQRILEAPSAARRVAVTIAALAELIALAEPSLERVQT